MRILHKYMFFGQTPSAYSEPVRDTASDDNRIALEAKAAQLSSLLMSLCGGGFVAFSGLPAANQDNILWLAADLAGEVSELAGRIW